MDAPLVSCIMPTGGRRKYVPMAVRCFLEQTYVNRELVVLDDGPDFIEDIVPKDWRISYRRCHRMNIGSKRNLAVAVSDGSLIAHWDDDDWSHPDRLAEQVERLLSSQAEITGYNRIHFAAAELGKAWLYAGPTSIVGTSMLYTRELWNRKPFPPRQTGEDNAFLQGTRAVSAPGTGMMVARIHVDSSTRKNPHTLGGSAWLSIAFDDLPEGFRCAL